MLTNVMIYLVTRSFNTATWICRGRADEGGADMPPGQRAQVPTAIANFPREFIAFPPQRMVETGYNVARWTDFPRGGHFAAMETDAVFADAGAAFVRQIRAGLLGGAMNALAGGRSFVTLPALIAAGVPSVQANASSTVALWLGGTASAWTYHARLVPICGVAPWPLLSVTIAGGLIGALLLLFTPSSAFDVILPWLLLLATVALAFGRRLGTTLRGRLRGRAGPVLVTQLVLGLYGGYFGGAVALMMLAAWSLLGEIDLKTLNGPRTLHVSGANTAALVVFVIAGAVRWPQTGAVLAGGLVGGVLGARLGRIAPAQLTRILTLCATTAITCVFFARRQGSVRPARNKRVQGRGRRAIPRPYRRVAVRDLLAERRDLADL